MPLVARRTMLRIGAPIAILVVVGAVLAGRELSSTAASAAALKAAAPAATVPIEAATAQRSDVPVYLTGLGTVQAQNTVTVKSRVDGQLQAVSYQEGQDVTAGQVLAQIDPRPFQAALDQAKAAKAKDEAQLTNAQLDLQRFENLHQYATAQSVDTQKALIAQIQAQIEGDQATIDHLPEENLPDISAAMAQGTLQVSADTRGDEKPLDQGTLTLIDNQIDQSTGTIRLKATFPNKSNTLWPGQFVDAKLLLRTQHDAVTVPATAVQRSQDGLYVYVVKPDGTVDTKPVDVDRIAGGVAVIQQGLDAGDRVVTAGQYRLQPGTHVEIREAAAASRPAAAPGA